MKLHFIEPGSRDHDHYKWLVGAERLLPIPGRSWLDVGCGSGHLPAELGAMQAKRAVGIDICVPEASKNARDWEFLKLDLNDETWPTKVPGGLGGFDVVTCFDIIEHLDSPVKFLLILKSLLKPGGRIVLTTPNTSSWERVVRGNQWSGASDDQHKILFSKYSLCFLLGRLGFQTEIAIAPIRKLKALGIPHPAIGAQTFVVAQS